MRDITTITKLEIKNYLNNLKNGVTGKAASKDTKLKYLRIIRAVFENAADNNVLDGNLADNIKLAGSRQSKKEAVMPFSPEEVALLLEKSEGEFRNYLGIAFNSGMSPSEIIGLQIGDIDFSSKTITMKRNISKGIIGDGKTEYRIRDIPLFNSAIPFFKEQIIIAKQKHSIWIFSKDDGSNLSDITDFRGQTKNNTKWYKLIRDCELTYRALKNTRHTFAVNAIRSKAFTLQEIAKMLGHSSLRMLINHYGKDIDSVSKNIRTDIEIYSQSS